MKTAVVLAAVLCAAAVSGTATDASAQIRRPAPAQLAPIVERDAFRAGGTARLALRVTLPEGFHTNANKPRDPLLIPIVLTVRPPAGVKVESLVYPKAVEIAQQGADAPLLVYEREFVIGVQVAIDPGLTGDISVPAELRYQACDEKMCYAPVKVPTAWTMRVAARQGAAVKTVAGAFSAIEFGRGEPPPPLPPETTPGLPAAPLSASSAAAEPAGDVQSTLAGLDRNFKVAGTTNYVSTGDFLQFIRNAEAGVVEKGMFEGRGPLAILLLVILGGLALNLTPCVLPMIPINLAIIGAGSQAGSRGRGLLLGAAYGSAMAVVYGVLGVVVVLTAGTFGTINASPWFNAGIATLFVVLALAMFDVINIDFSRFSSNYRVDEHSRGSVLLAFTMGAVAALLAGACVAPVVIQVVLLSSNMYATGTPAALALPFFLGLGMALPWPVAGAGIAALPKPGAWMVRVKQAFGVFILGTAVYYGYTSYELFASRWVDPAAVRSSVDEQLKKGWHASLPAGIAAAAREGKPVLLDMWATWCKNCLVMDKTTLADPEVNAALSQYVKIKFQAEDPDSSPAREVMQHFGAVGLPTYVILTPNGTADRRAAPAAQ
jgi:cytochrome c biogenesis protein CcdA/thiol-disulfide isomerase/thioredoxin